VPVRVGHDPILSDPTSTVRRVTTTRTVRDGGRTAPTGPEADAQPLYDTTFVVIDLETTGASPAADRITEIGAVKVRGGEVLGEFATLVDPGVGVPEDISGLTGITDLMVCSAPPLSAVLPSLLHFVRESVVVAHNAPFDVGFLHAGCAATGRVWPSGVVVDTVRLARAALGPDEVTDRRLATLAAFFRTTVTPDHRALTDARATVEVLHGLLERLGRRGVHTLGDLRTHSGRETTAQVARRHLADPLPHTPGVFTFRDGAGAALLTGRTEDLQAGVRRHFTGLETRVRMLEAVGLTATVDAVPCRTELEARLVERQRLRVERPRVSGPPPGPRWWVLAPPGRPLHLTTAARRGIAGGPVPRLGPFPSRATARSAADALTAAGPDGGPASLDDVGAVRSTGAPGLDDFLTAQSLAHRLRALGAARVLVAAAPSADGGWDVNGFVHGVLVAAERVPAEVHPGEAAGRVRDETTLAAHDLTAHELAGHELAGHQPTGEPDLASLELVGDWLDGTGTRLVALEGTWACPLALAPLSAGSRPPTG